MQAKVPLLTGLHVPGFGKVVRIPALQEFGGGLVQGFVGSQALTKTPLSMTPSQSSSIPLAISGCGSTTPAHAPHVAEGPQVRVPALQIPTPSVATGPV